jgi:hypothetical protein
MAKFTIKAMENEFHCFFYCYFMLKTILIYDAKRVVN